MLKVLKFGGSSMASAEQYAKVKAIVEEVHSRTLKILTDNRAAFEKIANLLLEKEVIFADDIEAILGPKVKAE